MKYIEFRDTIKNELLLTPAGLTWVELRDRLDLPYDSPCQNWVGRLEKEIGLNRSERVNRALVWKILSSEK